MSVEVQCPTCKAVGRVNSRFQGRRVHCPKCNGWVDVPAEAPVESNFDTIEEVFEAPLAAPISVEPIDVEAIEAAPIDVEPFDAEALEVESYAGETIEAEAIESGKANGMVIHTPAGAEAEAWR